MISKTVTFEDYNGVTRTETHYFNFSKAELMEMSLSVTGGLSDYCKKIIEAHDTPSLVKIFKKLLLDSYGEKSADGRRFIKSEEQTKAFSETEAYSILFMQFATDADAAAEFINGVIPADMRDAVDKAIKDGKIEGSDGEVINLPVQSTSNV